MSLDSLRCKECGTAYELDASYVCENCFGPLEVAYDYSELDPVEVKRRIQAGSTRSPRRPGRRSLGFGRFGIGRPQIRLFGLARHRGQE